jgi:hypothetical protein
MFEIVLPHSTGINKDECQADISASGGRIFNSGKQRGSGDGARGPRSR